MNEKGKQEGDLKIFNNIRWEIKKGDRENNKGI